MSARNRQYAGAARFIEIMPPGIVFRGFANVDHITSITFGEKMQEMEVPTGLVDDNNKALTKKENVPVGYTVTISVGTANNEFTFNKPEIAVKFWNEILNDIENVGVPCVRKPKMVPIVKAPVEAGTEGEDLEDPVIDDIDDMDVPGIDELQDIDELIDEAEAADDKTPTEH